LRISEAVVSTIDVGDVQLNLRGLSSPQGGSLSFEILAPSGVISPVLMRALEQDDFEFDSSLPGSEALGLAAARNLILSLEGHVQASVASTSGTRITVIVPVLRNRTAGRRCHREPGNPRRLTAHFAFWLRRTRRTASSYSRRI
jgi:hypothetical protein